MNKRLISFIYFICILNLFCYAQISENQEIFGIQEIGYDESASSMIQTQDGGFLIAGDWNNGKVFFLKLDACGDTLWLRTLEYGAQASFKEVLELNDGSFVAVGSCENCTSGDAASKMLLVKSNEDGIVTEYALFGSSNQSMIGNGMSLTNNNEIAITGFGDNTNNNGTSSFIYILNTDLTYQWHQDYSELDFNYGNDIIQNQDGGYTVTGTANDLNEVNYMYTYRTTSDGTLIWVKTMNSNLTIGVNNEAHALAQKNNENIVVVGTMFIGSEKQNELYIGELDFDSGDLMDSDTYGQNDYDDVAYDLELIAGDKVLVCGKQGRPSGVDDAWVLFLNGNFGPVSGYKYNAGLANEAYSIVALSQDGKEFAICGERDFADGDSDAIFFKREAPGVKATFTNMPQTRQLYARDLNTNLADITISGYVDDVEEEYSEMRLKVYRNGEYYPPSQSIPLNYENGTATFEFNYELLAELAHYDFKIYGWTGTVEKMEACAKDVVAGDVIVIQGQSNAVGSENQDVATLELNPFIRGYGSGYRWGYKDAWFISNPNVDFSKNGHIGLWGFKFAENIVLNDQVPVAIFNGAHSGKKISYFLPDDSDPLQDTNYGRLLIRFQKTNLQDKIRSLIWFQGETNVGLNSGTNFYKLSFQTLKNAWDNDYPNIEKYYIFQIRSGCSGDSSFPSLKIMEAHRQLADEHNDIEIMSTTGVLHDGCHFPYYGGYDVLGQSIYNLVARDLYDASNINNIEPPNIASAYLSDPEHLVLSMKNLNDDLVWEDGSEDDFLLEGTSASILSGTIENNKLVLELSSPSPNITNVSYAGHKETDAPFVKNTNGIGMVCFHKIPVSSIPNDDLPIANCQELNLTLNQNGEVNISATDINNNSYDNEGDIEIAIDVSSFDCNDLGENDVTLSVFDETGNVSICEVTVSVSDEIDPVLICHSIDLFLEENNITITPEEMITEVYDNCSISSILLSQNTFDSSDFGENNVTVSVYDESGNVSTCDVTVNVYDALAPLLTCHAYNIYLNENGNSVIISPEDVIEEIEDGIASMVLSQTTFTCADLGENDVTLSVYDESGNVSTCEVTVSVYDDVTPVIECHSIEIILNEAADVITINAADVISFMNDNCGISSNILSQNTFDCTHLGENNVTLSVSDESGNVSTCDVTVSVSDDIAPLVECHSLDLYLNENADMITITAADLILFMNDNCGISSSILSQNTFDCTDLGENNVSISVSDESGNVSTCEVMVRVYDEINPFVQCHSLDLFLNENGGEITINSEDVLTTANDNCGISSMTLSQNNFDCNSLGENNVTLSVSDESGNISICEVTVSVYDNIAPLVECHSLDLILNENTEPIIISPEDVISVLSDNCETSSMTLSQHTFDCADAGENNVILSVSDESGNVSSCEFVVTIHDNVAPIVECHSLDLYLNETADVITIYTVDVVTELNDNCGISNVEFSQNAFDCSSLGENFITLNVYDGSQNVSTCEVTVSVYDNIAPLVQCHPLDLYLNENGEEIIINPEDVITSINDNCGVASMSLDQNVFDCTNLGDSNVTLSVYDESGNVSICEVTVSVYDDIVPLVECHSIDLYLNENAENITILPVDVISNFSDNCEIASMTLSQAIFDCADVGGNNVTLSVYDESGNVSTCEVTVSVYDEIPPVLMCHVVDLHLNENADVMTIYTTDVVTELSDNCGISNVQFSQNAFDCSDLGQNLITLSVYDGSQNVSTCEVTVMVYDAVAPVVECHSLDLYLNEDADMITILPEDMITMIGDNCAVSSVELSQNVFDCSSIGENNVSLSVYDESGNASVCNVIVNVYDEFFPNVICHSLNLNLNENADLIVITPDDVITEVGDNCGVYSMMLNQDSFDCTFVGENIITLSVYDESQNLSTCELTITISDTISPSVVCQDIDLDLNENGDLITITYEDLITVIGNNCDISNVEISQSTFDCSNLGENIVTVAVYDENLNASTCEVTVSVVDYIAPMIECHDIELMLDESNTIMTIVPEDVITIIGDNCEVFSSLLDKNEFDCNDLGENNVTLSVSDESGNVSTCEVTVSVYDNVVPVLLCENVDLRLNENGDVIFITAEDIVTSLNDNCGISSIELSRNTFDCQSVGENVISLKAFDHSENISICEVTVSVYDDIAPVVSCQDIDLSLNGITDVITITPEDLQIDIKDNCELYSMSISQDTFDCASLGENEIKITVSDMEGNTNECLSNVNLTILGGLESTMLERVEVFPNPVYSNEFTLAIKSKEQKEVTLRVYDEFARYIFTEKIELKKGLTKYKMSSPQPTGMYFLQIIDQQEILKTMKFVRIYL